MKYWFFGSLVAAWFLGMTVGCSMLYKPDINIKDSEVNSLSGNKGKLEGAYNGK